MAAPGVTPLPVAVNVSPRQLADESLAADISDLLDETEMRADLLELEITESAVMSDPARAINMLRAIRSMGVRIALDDFGTGFSSLGMLKHFPIDTLKIDRSFICDIAVNPATEAIAQSIIAIGKALDLVVVAEGVETHEQECFVRERGCDQIQGFHVSRPLNADRFATLLRQRAHTRSDIKDAT
ncbi:EAL domain-containing protein [Paraburkholderia madseniana]|uniref:EAL domain-containing protein n=2 Tax=Paraburkholderia madseniana TaxID=2599607 RepID=A0A6N6VYL5_9BURK|nr:EAL domain-containing protein [Paraburkholderia madseniana]